MFDGFEYGDQREWWQKTWEDVVFPAIFFLIIVVLSILFLCWLSHNAGAIVNFLLRLKCPC
jgi:hypothetical protein